MAELDLAGSDAKRRRAEHLPAYADALAAKVNPHFTEVAARVAGSLGEAREAVAMLSAIAALPSQAKLRTH